MHRLTQLPSWFRVALVVFVAVLTVRYLAVIDTGVGHTTAIRTYVFWALVCAPVAHLVDGVARTIMSYRLVQLAVARVKTSRPGR